MWELKMQEKSGGGVMLCLVLNHYLKEGGKRHLWGSGQIREAQVKRRETKWEIDWEVKDMNHNLMKGFWTRWDLIYTEREYIQVRQEMKMPWSE
mmetsp:Transcript_35205/g.56951  ORF Transcript_35205/g.56951 Transcript_35205/m.56951 type:complete len:94 (-) Transcript_35205:483-764(-)